MPGHRKIREYARDYLNRNSTGYCTYCCVVLTEENRTVDHMIPTGRGGPNEFYNLVYSCSECNHRKSALTHIEYLYLHFCEDGVCVPENDTRIDWRLRYGHERLENAVTNCYKTPVYCAGR